MEDYFDIDVDTDEGVEICNAFVSKVEGCKAEGSAKIMAIAIDDMDCGDFSDLGEHFKWGDAFGDEDAEGYIAYFNGFDSIYSHVKGKEEHCFGDMVSI